MMRIFLSATLACLLAGCSLEPDSNRKGTVAEGIAVDSLRIQPDGSRFIRVDTATRIRFIKVHKGYACAQVLALGVDSVVAGFPPAYLPYSRVQLPGEADCALDSAGKDTTVTRVFQDVSLVRLANSRGKVTDSARVARGTFLYDSLKGVIGVTGTFSSGSLTFRDSSTLAPRFLFTDTVGPCLFLNQAVFAKDKDTNRVYLSWMNLERDGSNDSCGGTRHVDSVPVAHLRL